MEQLQISIPKPCHQDWNQMTPEERGRFCSSCNKTVVDFSDKTENEILNFINSHRNENICGRFRNDQLAEPVRIELPLPVYYSNLSFLNTFLLALLFCFGTSLFACSTPGNDTLGEMTIHIPKTSVQHIADTVKTTAPANYPPPGYMILGEVEFFTKGKVALEPDTAESSVVDTINLPPVDIIEIRKLMSRCYVVGSLTVETTLVNESLDGDSDSVPEKSVVPNDEINFFISVYPNPSDGLLSIQLQPDAEQYVQIDLFDESGRLIRNLVPTLMMQSELRTLQFDVSDQPPGIYFVRISAEDKVKTEKVVIAAR